MRCAPGELPRPDPTLHPTGTEGPDGNRGVNELRLLEHFGMRPSSDILDVGCGIGRLAYECASYLDDDATYTGLDIAPAPVEWLNANYAPRLPGFRFDLLEVHNDRYRPEAAQRPERARLPYDDDSFDVVCAFEVFMHVSPKALANYLREIARVLRPCGLAVATMVVIYPGERLHHGGRTYVRVAKGVHTRFPQHFPMRYLRPRNYSMAYDVSLVRSWLVDAGLEEVALLKGRVHTPKDDRPGPSPGVDGPAISHPCDVFAARTPPVGPLDA